MTDLIIYGILNILSFILFGLDAFYLKSDRSPMPRPVLVIAVVLGGGFGALCAMILYKHLLKDPLMKVLVPVFAVLQVLVAAMIRIFLF